MNNLDCTLSILEAHRNARAWSDSAVANDLLNQLGLDPKADAANPAPVVDPEEAEVAMAEAHAKDVMARAMAARAKLDAKEKARKPAPAAKSAPARAANEPAD